MLSARTITGLTVAILLALVAAWLSIRGASASAPSRPNIVLIVADDMSWHDGQAYGSLDVPTPNMMRLAHEGMAFDRAFQATAMCAVTRHQLYTGLDPVHSGAYPQHSWADPGTKSVFGYLQALGYRVGLTGKTHVGPAGSFPWEFLGDAGAAAGGVDENLPPVDLKAVEAFVARDAKQPFFVVVASHRPHAPWKYGDASKFDAAKLHVPPYLVDTPATRESLRHYYADITVLDGEVGQVLDILDRHGVAQNTLVIFTSEQGSSVPFAKWTLYDAGVRTEMIARWPGHVKPGTRTAAMVSYEDVTPTFIQAAGGQPPKGLDGISFLPVLTGATTTHRSYVFGIHTNLGIIGGEPYPIRSARDERYKLIRNLMPNDPYKNVLNNTKEGDRVIKDWEAAAAAGNRFAAQRLAAYNQRPAAELYDLSTDPWEMHNRADDPGLSGVRRRLQVELDRWMAQQADSGIPKEMQAFKHINPAIIRFINEHYPDSARNPDGTKIHP